MPTRRVRVHLQAAFDTGAVRDREAIGRSKGGLSTKHAVLDALGNPLDFILMPGQDCDLEGVDAFLPAIEAGTLLAEKAFANQSA